MRELGYCSLCLNDSISFWEDAFNPKKISSHFEPEELSKISAFRIVYLIKEGTVNEKLKQEVISQGFSEQVASAASTSGETFEVEVYFVGDIVDFEKVKHLFKPDVDLEKWKDKKFAVTYRDGEIFDIVPATGELETYKAVQSKEELTELFTQKTGVEFPEIKTK